MTMRLTSPELPSKEGRAPRVKGQNERRAAGFDLARKQGGTVEL